MFMLFVYYPLTCYLRSSDSDKNAVALALDPSKMHALLVEDPAGIYIFEESEQRSFVIFCWF